MPRAANASAVAARHRSASLSCMAAYRGSFSTAYATLRVSHDRFAATATLQWRGEQWYALLVLSYAISLHRRCDGGLCTTSRTFSQRLRPIAKDAAVQSVWASRCQVTTCHDSEASITREYGSTRAAPYVWSLLRTDPRANRQPTCVAPQTRTALAHDESPGLYDCVCGLTYLSGSRRHVAGSGSRAPSRARTLAKNMIVCCCCMGCPQRQLVPAPRWSAPL